jgi:penicillin-binding protein 2
MKNAIAQSCNVYFYTIGGGYGDIGGLGIDKIKKYLDNFNLGSFLGIDFPSEGAGLLPDPFLKEKKGEVWRIGDTYNISIGQGEFLATPLQIASYVAAIANGGIVYQPHFLKEKAPVVLKNNLIDKNNLKIVREGMRMAVSSPLGTGYVLNNLPFSAAGKSGTSEVIKNKKINSFFAAYAPYENPEIVILTLVEGAPEGILSATPAAKDILYWYWKNRLQNQKSNLKNQNLGIY